MATNKTVIIAGEGIRNEYPSTAAANTPGQLLQMNTSGQVLRHATAGGTHFGMVAIEDDLQGKDIDDDYAATANTRVQVVFLKPGMEINMLLADGENAAIGNFLESDGAGDLDVHAADASNTPNVANQIVGFALEALDLSDSSGADPASRRIKVKIV